ncbi:uncharacterized protein [Macaca nemestrina]|uniref:uncharacterized protein isoform X2 n=1 Tax=Macaca nemestrina TaxID=9545 RepID=UPI0039B99D3C
MSRSWGTQLLLAPGDKDPLPSGPAARLGDRGPEAKKLTTFEYLIKTLKEESSKHQAARKDPCTQMEDGFLQQGDGALGSSAQGNPKLLLAERSGANWHRNLHLDFGIRQTWVLGQCGDAAGSVTSKDVVCM